MEFAPGDWKCHDLINTPDAQLGEATDDIDITFRIWEKWSNSSTSASLHADWLENQTKN